MIVSRRSRFHFKDFLPSLSNTQSTNVVSARIWKIMATSVERSVTVLVRNLQVIIMKSNLQILASTKESLVVVNQIIQE